MKTFPIELIPRTTPPLERGQGFALLGETSSDWLRTLLSHQDFLACCAAWRFFLLPTSPSDNRPLGVACLPEMESAEAISDDAFANAAFPAGAIPLACMHAGVPGRPTNDTASLWIAVDSRLSADLPPELLQSLLPEHSVCVWLASTGLVGFMPQDQRTLHQLVSLPPLAAGYQAWQSPPLPVTLPPRLSGLSLLQPPAINSLFQDEAQSIGNQTDELEQLSGNSLSGQIQKHLIKLMDRLNPRTAKANDSDPASGAGATGSWLSAKLQKIMQSQRDAQLRKLLELLRRDPDQALKYALPIGGDMPYRGLASPANQLRPNQMDFSLAGLHGGGRADFWAIGQAMRNQLEQSYRRQANREIALGRPRRAAYIYAHLLGDYFSAALTLEQGGFPAEAAELWRHKLQRPQNAARCLVAAGQFSAAAEIYEQQNDFVAAGEIWQRAGDTDRAREQFHKAVRQSIVTGKPILAAELLDSRLDDREAAIKLLVSQWPSGTEPVRAVQRVFTWLAEDNNHRRAQQLLDGCVRQARTNDMLELATVTSDLATRYPDAAVRRSAEDHCRVAIATDLNAASPLELQERMARLRSLAVHDPSLSKDVNRFLTRQPRSSSPVVAPRNTPRRLAHQGRYELPKYERYMHFQMIRGDLLALGTQGYKLHAVRVADLASAAPQHQQCMLQLGQPLSPLEACAVHAATRQEATHVEIYFAGPTPVYFRSDHLPSPYQQPPWWLSTPLTLSGMPSGGCIATDQADGVWTLAADEEGLVLREMHSPDSHVRTYSMTETADAYVSAPVQYREVSQPLRQENLHLACVGNTPLVIIDTLLCGVDASGVHVMEPLAGSANAVCASLPHTRQRLAVAHCQGVDVYWLDKAGTQRQTIARGAAHQHIAFLHGAHLATISDNVLTIHRIRSQVATVVGQAQLPGQEVQALLSISATCIGVFYSDGSIDRFVAL